MIRNLKFLGAAALAALAMTAVLAGSASADVVTAEKAPAVLTGAQEGIDEFTVHGGAVKCATVKYTGTLASSPANTVTVKPTYSSCTFAGLAATVTMNGCEYLVHLNPAAGSTSGTVDIVNCSGKEITVTAPTVGTAKCIVHVPAQTGLGPGSVASVSSGATRELQLSLSINNISYSQTAGTAETGNCATKDATTGGTYTGKALVTGEESGTGTHIGLFLDN